MMTEPKKVASLMWTGANLWLRANVDRLRNDGADLTTKALCAGVLESAAGTFSMFLAQRDAFPPGFFPKLPDHIIPFVFEAGDYAGGSTVEIPGSSACSGSTAVPCSWVRSISD